MSPPAASPRPAPETAALRPAIAAARRAGDWRGALALLAQARTLKPDAAWAWTEAITLHRDHGEPAAALGLAEAMAASHPDSCQPELHVGRLHRARGDSVAALAAFTRARARDSSDVESVLELAREHFAQGHQDTCEQLLTQALALDTGNAALLACAQQALLGNDAPRALALFDQAAAKCPWINAAYLGAATALTRLGRADEAMSMLDRGVAQCGSQPPLHVRRMQLLREMGLYREAVAIGTEALASHPGIFQLWESMARLWVVFGTDAQLAAWLATAQPMREGERASLAALTGDWEAARGNHQAAIGHYQRAALLQPANPRHRASLALSSLRAFDIDGAAEHLRIHADLLAPTLRLRSRSVDPAQTYLGQVLNEYRLDTGLRATLETLTRAPDQRRAALLDLCAAHGDSTLLATALIDALWPGHAPEPACEDGAASPIPRRIAQYWDRATPPPDIAGIMGSWARNNPDFIYQRFDDAQARAYLATWHDRRVLLAYHRARAPAMKADLFRLAVLAQDGGVYADADDRCTAPLHMVLSNSADLVLYREHLGTLGNNFLACTPRHPFIRASLEWAVSAIERGDADILWLQTGPGMITRAVAHSLARGTLPLDQAIRTTRVLSRRQVSRVVSFHCVAGYKDTEQHWIKEAFSTGRAAQNAPPHET